MSADGGLVEREECERELRRVVDRLNSMPLTRAASASADVRRCAVTLVELGRTWGVPVPADAILPDLEPQGLGSMIAVLARDCLDAAGRDTDLQPMLTALVALRRALP